MSVRDGYGPAVSFGVTAHVAFVLVVVVVADDMSTDVGLVCESPQAAATAAAAAPIAPNAARRLSLRSVVCSSTTACLLDRNALVSPHCDAQMLGNFVRAVKRLRPSIRTRPYFCNICGA
jgi:hypothetical protein